MPRLSDMIARFTAEQRAILQRPVSLPQLRRIGTSQKKVDRLDTIAFAPNPGALIARTYLPADLRPGAPLVVVLHGCTQTAAEYDHGTGWSTLADRAGFAVLFPEQQRSNNPNLCFNWFDPLDTRRGDGEVASIAAMIGAMLTAHALDRARVYITGLSAGGAMATAMLATYPELFAAGAIIGGLPYGGASGMSEALAQMRGQTRAHTKSLRDVSPTYRGRWPAVSIWQGESDQTVAPVNADRLVEQWRQVHNVIGPPITEHGKRWTHRRWRGADGQVTVEEWRIAGMSHGVPIHPAEDSLGVAGPYMLDVELASTSIIADGWGLTR